MIIDTHCHINEHEYDNLNEVIESLKDTIIINSSVDVESSKEALDLALEYPNIYATIGIHPENIDNLDQNYLQFLEENIENPKVVAIGEIGLDYHFRDDNKETQKEVFINQLKLAQKYNKPVVIHSRDAINDVYEILKQYPVKADIHCFGSSKEMAKKFTDINCFIGVGGVLTFKNAIKLVEVVENTNINNILIETDSPYLAPVPLRGTKNTPLNTKYVVEKLAEIKNISIEEAKETLNNNAISFFNLKMI